MGTWGSGKSACSLKDPKIGKPQHHHHHHHHPSSISLSLASTKLIQTLHVPHVLELPELEDGDSDERLEGAPGIWFLNVSDVSAKSLDFFHINNRLIIASASFSILQLVEPTAGRLGGLEETQIRSQLGFWRSPLRRFPVVLGDHIARWLPTNSSQWGYWYYLSRFFKCFLSILGSLFNYSSALKNLFPLEVSKVSQLCQLCQRLPWGEENEREVLAMENGKLKTRRWCDLHAPRTARTGLGQTWHPKKKNAEVAPKACLCGICGNYPLVN